MDVDGYFKKIGLNFQKKFFAVAGCREPPRVHVIFLGKKAVCWGSAVMLSGGKKVDCRFRGNDKAAMGIVGQKMRLKLKKNHLQS